MLQHYINILKSLQFYSIVRNRIDANSRLTWPGVFVVWLVGWLLLVCLISVYPVFYKLTCFSLRFYVIYFLFSYL